MYSPNTRNFFVAASAVTEGLVSEKVRKFFLKQKNSLYCAEGYQGDLVVGGDEHETRKYAAFLSRGVDVELLQNLRRMGGLSRMPMPRSNHTTRRAQVEETLDLLVEIESGKSESTKLPLHKEDKDNYAEDSTIEQVIRAAYHKDLGYHSRRPKITHKPNWY